MSCIINPYMVAASATYAKWNAADKGAGIAITGGGFTATASGGSYNGVRADTTITGLRYLEFLLVSTSGGGSNDEIGFATATANLNSVLAPQAAAWTWQTVSAKIYNNNALVANATTLGNGDRLGAAIDADGHTIQWFKNGSLVVTTGFSGVVYPVFSGLHTTADASVVLCTAPDTWAGSAPSGYSPVLAA